MSSQGPPWSGGPGAIAPVAPPVNVALVASLVFPTFSVFKVVHHEHPFAFSPSAISVMP